MFHVKHFTNLTSGIIILLLIYHDNVTSVPFLIKAEKSPWEYSQGFILYGDFQNNGPGLAGFQGDKSQAHQFIEAAVGCGAGHVEGFPDLPDGGGITVVFDVGFQEIV